MSKETIILSGFWQSIGIPPPVREYRFDEKRLWRIDYAWPSIKLAVESEGGIWTRGRHTRGGGFKKDMEKYNALTEAGWILLRYEPKHIDYLQIKRVIEKLMPRL